LDDVLHSIVVLFLRQAPGSILTNSIDRSNLFLNYIQRWAP